MIGEKLKKEYTDELVMSLCSDVRGIGQVKAGAIAAEFDGNLQEFLSADEDRFKEIQRSSGSRILRDEEVEGIIEAKRPIIGVTDPSDAWMFYLGKRFLKSQIETVNGLTIDRFDFNPFLVKVLDLNTPRQIIVFNTYQTVTRSVVTAWGNMVENMLKYSGDAEKCKQGFGGGRKGRTPDLVKAKGGIKHYIQVKSGPNTMNVDMVNSLNEVIREIEGKIPKSKVLLGMTYGTRNQISQQIRGNLEDFDERTLIGRELWDFISGESDYHKKLFKILDDSSRGLLNTSFIELIEDKIKELEEEWKKAFKGLSLEEILEKYV